MRKVNALFDTAAAQALCHGTYSAAFRGFRICAVRRLLAQGPCISIAVNFGAVPHARERITTLVLPTDCSAPLVGWRGEGFNARCAEPVALARVI